MLDGERAPAGINPRVPNVARVYDYLIGGKDNFAGDRAMGDQVLRLVPEATKVGLASRAFLRRAVRHMVAEAGIRQFIDIGSGLPTQGNVHEIAQELDPGARVVYVDYDPVVLVHTRALLENHDTTVVITADLDARLATHRARKPYASRGLPPLTRRRRPQEVVARKK